jgi:hypothetical protein
MADPRFCRCADINAVEAGAPSTRALTSSDFCCRISPDRAHDEVFQKRRAWALTIVESRPFNAHDSRLLKNLALKGNWRGRLTIVWLPKERIATSRRFEEMLNMRTRS